MTLHHKKEGSDVILLGLKCVMQPPSPPHTTAPSSLFIVYLCDCALCEVNNPASSTQVVASATGSGQAGSSGRKRGRKFNSNLDSDQQLFAPEGETQIWKPNTGTHYLMCNSTNHLNVTQQNSSRSSFTLSLLCYQVISVHTIAFAH